MSFAPRKHTLAVAHRGYSARAPENTLAAFREALEAGAAHVECDVHASADGTPYVIHDATVDRTTGSHGAVNELRDAELDGLEAGSWKAPRYRGEPLPKLRDLLELLRGRASLALEIKAEGMEEAVLRELDATQFSAEALTLFAFDYPTLLSVRAKAPHLHCTTLQEERLSDADWSERIARAAADGMAAIGPGAFLVDAALIQAIHRAGLSAFVWTVDEPEPMRLLAGYGVDAIMTNQIEVGLATLADCPKG